MTFLRAVLERLLLVLFAIARTLFVFQGLSSAVAAIAVFAAAPAESPPWLRNTLGATLVISGTFFVAGVLLIAARRLMPERDEPRLPAAVTMLLLVVAVIAAVAARGLPELWRTIAIQLNAMEFWEGVRQPGGFGGIILLPIMAALFVPGLVTAAAVMSIGFPLAMAVLVVERSRLVARLLLMGAVCQATLLANGWIATEAFARLTSQLFSSVGADTDAEVVRVAGDIEHATSVLTNTTFGLLVPLVGLFVCLALVIRSRRDEASPIGIS